jgi:transposase InsO family protein
MMDVSYGFHLLRDGNAGAPSGRSSLICSRPSRRFAPNCARLVSGQCVAGDERLRGAQRGRLRPPRTLPMAKGFVYLAVVLDWFSRRVLLWRVSITMEASFCIEALQEALAKHAGRRSSTWIRARSSRVKR